GYAVGGSGIILKTNDGGVISSVDNISAKPAFKVYPNPATDKMTIEIAEDQAPRRLSMMNLNGEEVLTRSLIKPKTQIDISNLPSDVYFVRVTNDKTVDVG